MNQEKKIKKKNMSSKEKYDKGTPKRKTPRVSYNKTLVAKQFVIKDVNILYDKYLLLETGMGFIHSLNDSGGGIQNLNFLLSKRE